MEYRFRAVMTFDGTVEAGDWEEAYEKFMDSLREYHESTLEWDDEELAK